MDAGPGRPLDPGSEDPRLGEVVAHKYRLDRVVASGGMGTVFEAEHLRLGRRVAVKLLHPDRLSDAEHIKRFHKEARKAASLTHSGIIEVRDFGHDELAGPYLEMELLEGASVEQLLRTHGPLPIEVALHITCEALGALASAHARNIVHRDLKPNNLFVCVNDAGYAQVKVLDFGIARIFTSDLEESALEEDTFSETLTKTGVLLGTLNYMSPEQFLDAREVDHRSDLYSMGATLFELLTNTPVVTGATVFECVTHVTHGEILRHPQVYRDDTPRWVDALVARCLALKPEDRFESAEAMREAIAMHASIDEVTARKRLGEMASVCHRGAKHRASSQADTRLAGREPTRARAESGPIVVVADSDGGIRVDTTGSSQNVAPDSSPPSGDRPSSPWSGTLRTPMTAEVDGDSARSSQPPRGGRLKTAILVVAAVAVGAGTMALLKGGPGEPASEPRAASTPPATAGAEEGEPPAIPAAFDAVGTTTDEIDDAPTDEEPSEAPAAEAQATDDDSTAEETTTGGTVADEDDEARPRERRRAARERRQTRRQQQRTRRRETAASRETGTVTINTIPASRVFIDGRDTGHTTPLNGYTVPAGEHRLELRLPDGTSHTYPIRVEAGESERVFRVLPH